MKKKRRRMKWRERDVDARRAARETKAAEQCEHRVHVCRPPLCIECGVILVRRIA